MINWKSSQHQMMLVEGCKTLNLVKILQSSTLVQHLVPTVIKIRLDFPPGQSAEILRPIFPCWKPCDALYCVKTLKCIIYLLDDSLHLALCLINSMSPAHLDLCTEEKAFVETSEKGLPVWSYWSV